MPRFLKSSLSVGLGALAYELVVRGPHGVKWLRVGAIVLVALPVTWLIFRSKEKKATAQA